MAESQLSFESSKEFRNKLLARNLPAYTIPGTYGFTSEPATGELVLSDSAVVDSPEELISDNVIVDRLYPLNKFGPEGGYSKEIYYNNPPLPVESNSGPYDISEAKLGEFNSFFMDTIYVQNKFGPEGGYNLVYEIGEVQNNDRVYLPYWDPPLFRPSSYTPYAVLMQDVPTGSEGSVTQDSYMVQLNVRSLRGLLAYRAAISDNASALLIGDPSLFGIPNAGTNVLRGNFLFPENDYRITIPPSTDTFLTRLQGVYIPSSPIPGDYFMDELNTRSTGNIGQLINVFAGRSTLLGDIFGPAVSRVINPSIVFLENTSSGQKSALFSNLRYNRYKPQYGSTTLGGLANNLLTTGVNAILNSFGTQLPGDFYVGSVISNPVNVESPVRDVPIDAFGKETGAIVYGGQELGKLYEGNDDRINFGLKAKSFSDGNGIAGNFVWVSPKYKDDAGFKVGPGGSKYGTADVFNQIEYDYTKNESTEVDFKVGSILDDTQRLINAADRLQGERRLMHVGNAMNQVSKVFHDGYKEMTKGSKVLSYINQSGVEVGQEYCRVFAKDIPYYTFSQLQKTDGNIRKFTYSVLDKSYNLNIAPLKGNESTNIVGTSVETKRVKKYMFSIENLAWKNSSRNGLRVSDLPSCERGPNGGRIMWFPPYNIKFSENVRANWHSTTFLGRPEPVYTYKDTSRGGTLTWSIVVDHPSILNLIVNKVLSQENNRQKVDSIIDSFFAGCKKYDLYELAKIYNTIPSSQLQVYQEILSNPRLTEEQASSVIQEIPKENVQPENSQKTTTENVSLADYTRYVNLGFYFENNVPSSGSQNFDSEFSTYTSTQNQQLYASKNNAEQDQILTLFGLMLSEFTELQTLLGDIYQDFEEGAMKNITLELGAFASGLGGTTSNNSLSQTRCDVIKNYIESYVVTTTNGVQNTLKKYIDNGTLTIRCTAQGEGTVTPKGAESVNCSTTPSSPSDIKSIYSAPAMACRSVRILGITPVEADPKPQESENKEESPTPSNASDPQNPYTQQPIKPNFQTGQTNLRPGLTKKILRELLSECDYFEVIKETDPMIYETIKEKIKYFNPAFHSITPEGLNSRLTFLQQCLRPGDTIPTIGPNNEIKQDSTLNTTFASPPVLVLRIGDFYNTKIIPNNIDITFEPLVFDLNPEGIGVQPMLANITMGFNFIGGSGLAKPLEQLQNSLSFNYYANTEMYDERAEPTEDTSKIDKEVFDAIVAREQLLTTKDINTPKENPGGTTIGSILVSTGTSSEERGEISYQNIMDELLRSTQEYFDITTGKLKTIVETYNRGVLELITSQRQYIDGNPYTSGPSFNVEIFGKPFAIQEKVSSLITQIIQDIENGNSPLVDGLTNFTQIGDVKANLVSYFENLELNWTTEVVKVMQELTDFQQKFVQIPRKVDFVMGEYDGKVLKNGDAITYTLTPTTEVDKSTTGAANTYEELENDYITLSNDINNFIVLLKTKNVVTNTYTTGSAGDFNNIISMTIQEKRLYMILSKIFLNKDDLQKFNDTIITGPLKDVRNPQNLYKVFEKITDGLKDTFKQEHKKELDFINDVLKSPEYKPYRRYKPFTVGKVRKFNFDGQPLPSPTINDELKNVYAPYNLDNNVNSYQFKIVFK